MKKFKISTKTQTKTVKKFVSIAAIAFLFNSSMITPLSQLFQSNIVKAGVSANSNITSANFVIDKNFKISKVENTHLSTQRTVTQNDITTILGLISTQNQVDHSFVINFNQLIQILAQEVKLNSNLELSVIKQLISNAFSSGQISINSNMNFLTIIKLLTQQINAHVNITINIYNCEGDSTHTYIISNQQGQITTTNQNPENENGRVFTQQQTSDLCNLTDFLTNELLKHHVDLNQPSIRLWIFTNLMNETLQVLPGMNIDSIVNEIISQLNNGPVINGLSITQQNLNDKFILIKFLTTQAINLGVKVDPNVIENYIRNNINNGVLNVTVGTPFNIILDQIVNHFNNTNSNNQNLDNEFRIPQSYINDKSFLAIFIAQEIVKNGLSPNFDLINAIILQGLNNHNINISVGMTISEIINQIKPLLIEQNYVTSENLNNINEFIQTLTNQILNSGLNVEANVLTNFIKWSVDSGKIEINLGTNIHDLINTIISNFNKNQLIVNINSNNVQSNNGVHNYGHSITSSNLSDLEALIRFLATSVHNHGIHLNNEEIIKLIHAFLNNGSIRLLPNLNINSIILDIVNHINNTNVHGQTITEFELINTNEVIQHIIEEIVSQIPNVDVEYLTQYLNSNLNSGNIKIIPGMTWTYVINLVCTNVGVHIHHNQTGSQHIPTQHINIHHNNNTHHVTTHTHIIANIGGHGKH